MLRRPFLLLAILILPIQALAQAAAQMPTQVPAQAPAPSTQRQSPPPRALPADKATHHEITLGATTLRFTATAGSIRLTNAEGIPQADLAFTAFTLDGADPRTRPVTLAVNGGPGASSAWLNLGAVGPWRVPFPGNPLSPSAPPTVVDNTDTWLADTDLVFFDPPGTGWSRALSEDARKRAWSVSGDITMLSEAARRWLESNRRLPSPKLVLGESYGGFRGPRLVRALQSDQGVGIAGLILVSPVLDFGGRADGYDPMPYVTRLPGMAAAARNATTRAALADVETYAMGDYLHDLWRGESDPAATDRISRQVAAFLPTLDPQLIRRRAGRIDVWTFLRETHRDTASLGSIYDPAVTTADPFPTAAYADTSDPILEPMRAVMTSAVYDLYARRLDWLPDGKYEILNNQTIRQWDWGRGRTAPESYTALRRALALDPALHVLVAHGIADLITPYFGSKVILDTIPDLGPPNRLSLQVYPGGHMFYANDASRAAFHADAAALIGTLVRTVAPAAAADTPPPAVPTPPAPGTPPPPAPR